MKQLYTLIAFLFIISFSYCQTTIKLEDASKHAGDSVKVCGKVFSTRYLDGANSSKRNQKQTKAMRVGL